MALSPRVERTSTTLTPLPGSVEAGPGGVVQICPSRALAILRANGTADLMRRYWRGPTLDPAHPGGMRR